MTKAFVVKTVDETGYVTPGVFESLKNGKARIGWSYSDDLDLRVILQAMAAGIEISEDQRGALRCRNFLEWVSTGDYLLYPHQPEYGRFAIAKVIGDYNYSPAEQSIDGDFQSYRPCKLLLDQGISWTDKIVPPRLKVRLGLQGRFYKIHTIDLFEELLRKLHKAGEEQTDFLTPRNEIIFQELLEKIPNLLQQQYPRKDLSSLCHELFSRMGFSVDLKEGPSEKGSDLLVNVSSEILPTDFVVGVQIFSWEGDVTQEDLRKKLDQLLDGWGDNGLDYGILLTTGQCSTKVREVITQHNRQNTKQCVRLIDGKGLASLFVKYFANDLTEQLADNT